MKLVLSEVTTNQDDLKHVVDLLKPYLIPQTLWLLDGDLGAGKTTLIYEIMNSFGYTGTSSPTYALRNSYENIKIKNNFITVEHLDLYRLKNAEDIDSTGMWDIFQNMNSLIIIEWGNRISPDQWPLNWKRYQLNISILDFNRKYEVFEF